MQLSIFAKTFSALGAAPVLKAVHDTGFDCAQFNMACVGLASMPDEIAPKLAEDIAAASKASGVSISAVSGTYNMAHPDIRVRADGLRRLGVIIANAKALGTNLVTLCTGTRDVDDQWRWHKNNATPEAWRDLTIEMEKALKIAEAHGIYLGIEPELGNIVSSAQAAKRLLDEMKSPHLRVVLDPANLFEVASEQKRHAIIDEAVDLLGGSIVMAHAKDRDAKGAFVAAGKGVIDFRHFVNSLKQAGFNGPLVTHGLTEAEAPSVAAFLKSVIAA